MILIDKNKLGMMLNEYQYALSPSDRTDDVEKIYTRKDLDLATYEVVGHCMNTLDKQEEIEAIPIEWLKKELNDLLPNTYERLVNNWRSEKDNKPRVGQTITIISMAGEPEYCGKTGVITHIDDAGQLHGTWGGLTVIPGDDIFEIHK